MKSTTVVITEFAVYILYVYRDNPAANPVLPPSVTPSASIHDDDWESTDDEDADSTVAVPGENGSGDSTYDTDDGMCGEEDMEDDMINGLDDDLDDDIDVEGMSGRLMP